MTTLLALVFLLSIAALVVGLIRPSLVLRWEKDEDKHTRKNVLKYFLTTVVVTFVLIAVIPTPDSDIEVDTVEAEDNREDKINMSDKDIEVLSKGFLELNDDELNFADKTRYRIDNVEDSKNKEIAIEHLSRLAREENEIVAKRKAEEEKKAEEERIAREEQERKDKIAAEKKAEEERIAEEKAEKEKYNTGITWKDMARDKDGLLGSLVKFKGKIIQVMSGDGYMQYRMAVDSDYDRIILIEIQDDLLDSNIIEDDIITVEGMSMGNMEYTTVMGAKQSIPSMIVANFTTH